MKQTLLGIGIFALAFGLFVLDAHLSGYNSSEPAYPAMTLKSGTLDQTVVQVYELDSCEYIGSHVNTSWAWMTHKGDCRFCAARESAKDTVVVKRPKNAGPKL